MAVATGTLMALSSGLSMVGQLAQGRAANKAAQAQAMQDELRAAQEQDAARQEAERIRKAGTRTQGAARAQMAANGIDANRGSSLTIEEQIGTDSEKDARMTLLTGKRRADAYHFSANQSRSSGRNALTASALGAVTTGLQAWKGVSTDRLWAPAVVDDGYSIGQGSAYDGSRKGL